MRKLFLAAVAAFAVSASSYAGGYLTNTNQNASYLRNPARLATFELDGAYSNPAGLAWIGEGWHFMFNWQNAAQTRKITSTFAPFAQNVNQLGNPTKTFKGEASAPFIPSLDVAYQKGKFTASMHFGITGGGGKCDYSKLYGQLNFLQPGTIPTWTEFLKRYVVSLDRYGNPRAYNEPACEELMHRFGIFVRLDSIVDMPDTIETIVPVPIGRDAKVAYDDICHGRRRKWGIIVRSAGSQFTKL